MEIGTLNQRIAFLEHSTKIDGEAGVTQEVVSLEFTVRQTPDTKRINTTTHKLRFRGLVYDINGVLPNYKSLDYMKITAGTRKAGEQDDFD